MLGKPPSLVPPYSLRINLKNTDLIFHISINTFGIYLVYFVYFFHEVVYSSRTGKIFQIYGVQMTGKYIPKSKKMKVEISILSLPQAEGNFFKNPYLLRRKVGRKLCSLFHKKVSRQKTNHAFEQRKVLLITVVTLLMVTISNNETWNNWI